MELLNIHCISLYPTVCAAPRFIIIIIPEDVNGVQKTRIRSCN